MVKCVDCGKELKFLKRLSSVEQLLVEQTATTIQNCEQSMVVLSDLTISDSELYNIISDVIEELAKASVVLESVLRNLCKEFKIDDKNKIVIKDSCVYEHN